MGASPCTSARPAPTARSRPTARRRAFRRPSRAWTGDAQAESQRTLYMNRQGRNRFKDFLRHRYQRIDEVQALPNLERPDVYAKDVARIRRDGFAQKAGTQNPYMDQAEIDAMTKKNTVRLASGEVVQTSASKAFSTPTRHQPNFITRCRLPLRDHDQVGGQDRHREGPRCGGRPHPRPRALRKDAPSTGRPAHQPPARLRRQVRAEAVQPKVPGDGAAPGAGPARVQGACRAVGEPDFEPRPGRWKREEHHNGFSQAKAARTRETSHRQAAGYMDGGMLVHELTTSTALQARVPADKNVRRKEKPYRRILNEQQSAAQDSGNTVDKNLRIYGDAHKPVVRLNRLVRIPGVMAKRGVGDTDLYDASRPHKVGPRIDRKKDANSKKGVRRDYGHYTNQFVADDPHQSDVRTNAIDIRGQSHVQEFGRQTGAARPTSRTPTRTANRRTTSRTRSSPTSRRARRCERATTRRKRRTTSTSTSSPGRPPRGERLRGADGYPSAPRKRGRTGRCRSSFFASGRTLVLPAATQRRTTSTDGAEQPAIRHRDDADVATTQTRERRPGPAPCTASTGSSESPTFTRAW